MPQTLEGWLELLEFRHHTAIDLGLDRVSRVWKRMGSPRPAQRVFVVAGTNGKGSTVASIGALLEGLGYSHGSYTTPHISAYNERVQIGRDNVGDCAFIESFERIEAVRGDVSLSYFEFGTLAAFDILNRAGLDFAVMEIGLGGRLDAVNLLDADCTVITPIGLDHQAYLGNDLESIGREKAGIIRPHTPVIVGESNPPASVMRQARACDAPAYRFGVEFNVQRNAEGLLFTQGDVQLQLPLPVLPGRHQYGNAATAVAAVLQLLPEAAQRLDDLCRGLRSVALPGRFQRVMDKPVMWIDVGHNAMGARAIADTLLRRIAAGECRQVRCVLAMLADKDAGAVAAEMDRAVTAWYTASLAGDRGQSAQQLAARIEPVLSGTVDCAGEAGARGQSAVQVCNSVSEAIESALGDSSEHDGVLVFGSFFTASAAFEWLRDSSAKPWSLPGETKRRY